ncbi:hypothetical protein ACG3SL_00485 [Sphingomonas sp. CJ20]
MAKMHARGFIARTGALLASRPGPALLCVAILSLPWIAIDWAGFDQRGGYIFSVASLFAQFMVTSALLRDEDAHHAWGVPGRAASFVGVSTVSTLAIGAGLLVFVLPGLFLFARWLLVTPLVVGRGASMAFALRESWRLTRPHTVPILLALVALLAPAAVGLGLQVALYPEYGPVPLALAVAANLLLFGSNVAQWYLAVAVYLMVSADLPEPVPELQAA